MLSTRNKHYQWLLIFYTVPSKPVKNRMRIWRQLATAGAIQLKGAVYILPYSEEHYELLQWTISEVASMGGAGSFVKAEAIETMTNDEIKSLFNAQRELEYKVLDKALDELETRLSSMRKGTKGLPDKALHEELAKHRRDCESIKNRDFFSSPAGSTLGRRLHALEVELRNTLGLAEKKETAAGIHEVILRRREDFQGKTWVTRKRPFVDRMASAWIIRKFIDSEAVFEFIDEKDICKLDKGRVAFDVRDGVFTHTGDLCTFEVLLRAFSLKDKVLRRIAEIVHQLDLKDERYQTAEAKGIEDVLLGIRKTAGGDQEALERGMVVFEMIYASKK